MKGQKQMEASAAKMPLMCLSFTHIKTLMSFNLACLVVSTRIKIRPTYDKGIIPVGNFNELFLFLPKVCHSEQLPISSHTRCARKLAADLAIFTSFVLVTFLKTISTHCADSLHSANLGLRHNDLEKQKTELCCKMLGARPCPFIWFLS